MRQSSNNNKSYSRFRAVVALLFLAETRITIGGQTPRRGTEGEAIVVGNNDDNDNDGDTYNYPDDPKCFESTAELRQAVAQYQSEDDLDSPLAARYGWPIGHWCVSNVNDFSNLFQDHRFFDEELNDWDVSSATDMSGVFQNCHWFNRPLHKWDMSSVQTTARMFAAARNFNQDISMWHLDQSCEDMSYMFLHAFSFHQNLNAWKIGSGGQFRRLRTLEGIFRDARSFDDAALTWDVSRVANTKSMVSSIPGVSLNLRGGGGGGNGELPILRSVHDPEEI